MNKCIFSMLLIIIEKINEGDENIGSSVSTSDRHVIFSIVEAAIKKGSLRNLVLMTHTRFLETTDYIFIHRWLLAAFTVSTFEVLVFLCQNLKNVTDDDFRKFLNPYLYNCHFKSKLHFEYMAAKINLRESAFNEFVTKATTAAVRHENTELLEYLINNYVHIMSREIVTQKAIFFGTPKIIRLLLVRKEFLDPCVIKKALADCTKLGIRSVKRFLALLRTPIEFGETFENTVLQDIIRMYSKDPLATSRKFAVELGLVETPAAIFALCIFLCDDLLKN